MENVTIEFQGWNVGSKKVFKAGKGLAIYLPQNIVDEQGIESGHTVEIFVKKTKIPKKVRSHFNKRWDPKVEEDKIANLELPLSIGGDIS